VRVTAVLDDVQDAVWPAGGQDCSVVDTEWGDQLVLLGEVGQSRAGGQFGELVAGVADLLEGRHVGWDPPEFGVDQAGPARLTLIVLDVHRQDSHRRSGARRGR
jgi:hypothetical protein